MTSLSRAVTTTPDRAPQRRPVAGSQGIATWIERRARLAPARVALVHGETTRSYGELARRVRRLARALRALGVERGDRVSWLGENHPAFLEGLFASATLGAVFAPINHRLPAGAIRAICDDIAPRVVLADAALAARLPRTLAAQVLTTSDGVWSEYERLLASQPDSPLGVDVTPDEVCLLPFTSGTTDRPKGVMLTHANVTWNIVNCVASLGVGADEVTIAVAPFFRSGGPGVTVLPVLASGGTVVIPRGSDPDEIFGLIERHQATLGFGSPDLLRALAESPRWQTANLSSLRAMVTGGAPVPERLLDACRARGLMVLPGYGLSEAAPLVSVLDVEHAATKAGSVGRPALFVETRIRLDGIDCAPGEVGELFVSGPNVTPGYWHREDATQRAIDPAGWLRTGDAVYADEDGFLFIVGRMEDAYASGGELVHPGVVERVLLGHPQVVEACVVGRSEGATAYIVAPAGEGPRLATELAELSRMHLPAHARPADFAFVRSLPKNPAGKILRHVLRAQQIGRAG